MQTEVCGLAGSDVFSSKALAAAEVAVAGPVRPGVPDVFMCSNEVAAAGPVRTVVPDLIMCNKEEAVAESVVDQPLPEPDCGFEAGVPLQAFRAVLCMPAVARAVLPLLPSDAAKALFGDLQQAPDILVPRAGISELLGVPGVRQAIESVLRKHQLEGG